MSYRKSRFEMTPEKFLRFLKEGRGQGAGPSYRPWIRIDDLSSIGRVHRTACALTGFRTHHFLSDNEWYAFLNYWWDEDVEDIREQYPLLPLALTVGIAKTLGVDHPQNVRPRFYIPQTSDFFLVRKAGGEVMAVKEDEELASPRTAEKLAIANEFWKQRGIPTRLALASNLKTRRSANLQWIYQARRRPNDRPYCTGECRLHDYLVNLAIAGPLSSRELASRSDVALALRSGTSLAAIRRLLSERVLVTDIDKCDITKECEISFGDK